MKCEIANDLLTLYVEDLCSPETRKELELHLGECEDCSKKLEHYRKELKDVTQEVSGERDAAAQQKTAEIEPMKKVGKKMKKSKIKIAVLSLILLIVLGGIGILSFGEATNVWPGFTMIADMIKIKSACKDLAKGEVEAFVDLMAIRVEDQYILRTTGAFEDMDAYKAEILEKMNKAYDHYFKGKEIRVEFGEVELIPFFERGTADESTSYIIVNFYEGDVLLRSMGFTKVSKDYFTVYEDMGQVNRDPLVPSFTDGLIPYDDIIYKVAMPYYAQSNYMELKAGLESRMGVGLELIVEKSGDEENEEFTKHIREKMEFLKENACYIKNVSYNLVDYDDTIGKWIYKVWITYEDQYSGAVFVTEQKFISHNNNLYVIDGETSVLSSITAEEKSINEEVVLTALQMFE